MRRLILGRILWAVPLLLGVLTLVFVVADLAPGDPATLFIGPGVSPEAAAQLRDTFGLDDPLPVRYLRWLTASLTGDFGYSFSQARPVSSAIAGFLPNTLLLSSLALLVAFGLGILIGVVQAIRQNSLVDSILSALSLFFYSMPSFWLAIMLIMVFAVLARNVWELPIFFPASGVRSVNFDLMSPWEQLLDRLYHLVLPVMALSLVLVGGVARFTRASMLEVIRQDFVRTARAKGLPERVVVFKHALRNALLPVITLLGLYLPLLFTGAVFVEVVFGWPGMGWALVEAVDKRDFPLLMAVSSIFGVMVIRGNLLADVLYAVVDPRVRHE